VQELERKKKLPPEREEPPSMAEEHKEPSE